MSSPLFRGAPDAGDGKRQCACSGRCSLEARSPDLRQSQAVSHALSFFQLDGFAVPAPAQVSPSGTMAQAVETVEKVTFQKLFLKSGKETSKKRLIFGAPHNILVRIWIFFSLLWEIFLNLFRAKGFSRVSLGGCDPCERRLS
jgi:hypothetical protein